MSSSRARPTRKGDGSRRAPTAAGTPTRRTIDEDGGHDHGHQARSAWGRAPTAARVAHGRSVRAGLDVRGSARACRVVHRSHGTMGSMSGDYEDVTMYTLDADVEERLLLAHNECTFIWSNREG